MGAYPCCEHCEHCEHFDLDDGEEFDRHPDPCPHGCNDPA